MMFDFATVQNLPTSSRVLHNNTLVDIGILIGAIESRARFSPEIVRLMLSSTLAFFRF